MKQLPNNFLVFNEEGVVRVSMTFQSVANFDAVAQRLVEGSPRIIHNVARVQGNPLHIFTLNGESGYIILISQPFPVTTLYVLDESESKSFITPLFAPQYRKERQVEVGKCQYAIHPGQLAASGIVMYLIHSPSHGVFLVWKTNDQIYLPPLGNIHDQGNVCLGSGNEARGASLIEMAEHLLTRFQTSEWNQDLTNQEQVALCQRFFRFSTAKEGTMLPIPATGANYKSLRVCTSDIVVSLFATGVI